MSDDADRGLSFTVTISPEITQAPLEAAVADIQMSFEEAQQRAWQELVARQPAWEAHQIMPRSRIASTAAMIMALEDLGYAITEERPDDELWIITAAQNAKDPITGGGFCRLTALAIVVAQAHARYERMREIGVIERQ